MIDLHAHILAGLDDGPDTLEKAVAMARIAVSEGIDTIVATPHCLNGVYRSEREQILAACMSFNEELLDLQIPLTILPGAEIHFCPEIVDELRAGHIMTVNDGGRYFLLEMPDLFMPMAARTFIHQMNRGGVTPIVCHPERNATIQRNPALLNDLVAAGALTQITGASLLGKFGSNAKDCCRKLLWEDAVHLVASDAHSPGGRPPALQQAKRELASLIGSEQADWMVNEAPRFVIGGLSVTDGKTLNGGKKTIIDLKK